MDVKRAYETLYLEHGLERTGLFACLRKTFPAAEAVAYPGSSIHLAPSFVFRNVTYIDRMETTIRFFRHTDEVRAYVNTRKTYREEPRIRFHALDYSVIPDGMKDSFDLAFALYAPGALPAAAALVKPGGIVAYLPLPQEERTGTPAGLVQVGVIAGNRDRYRYVEDPAPRTAAGRRRNRKAVFVENHLYRVYRKPARESGR